MAQIKLKALGLETLSAGTFTLNLNIGEELQEALGSDAAQHASYVIEDIDLDPAALLILQDEALTYEQVVSLGDYVSDHSAELLAAALIAYEGDYEKAIAAEPGEGPFISAEDYIDFLIDGGQVSLAALATTLDYKALGEDLLKNNKHAVMDNTLVVFGGKD